MTGLFSRVISSRDKDTSSCCETTCQEDEHLRALSVADEEPTSPLTSTVPEEAAVISRAHRVADVLSEEAANRGQLRFINIRVCARLRG